MDRDDVVKVCKETSASSQSMGDLHEIVVLGSNFRESLNKNALFDGKLTGFYRNIELEYDGGHLEFDGFGEGDDLEVIVEVKAKARVGDIRELADKIKRYQKYLSLSSIPPAKQIYGMLASVRITDTVIKKAIEHGFLIAKAHPPDDVRIEVINNSPKNYSDLSRQ